MPKSYRHSFCFKSPRSCFFVTTDLGWASTLATLRGLTEVDRLRGSAGPEGSSGGTALGVARRRCELCWTHSKAHKRRAKCCVSPASIEGGGERRPPKGTTGGFGLGNGPATEWRRRWRSRRDPGGVGADALNNSSIAVLYSCTYTFTAENEPRYCLVSRVRGFVTQILWFSFCYNESGENCSNGAMNQPVWILDLFPVGVLMQVTNP